MQAEKQESAVALAPASVWHNIGGGARFCRALLDPAK
jgi:hypothetical protein